jgi:hypothetical protein
MPIEIKPGMSLWKRSGPYTTKYHVRAIVDNVAVCRWWSPRRGWRYTCEFIESIQYFIKEDVMFLKKPKK